MRACACTARRCVQYKTLTTDTIKMMMGESRGGGGRRGRGANLFNPGYNVSIHPQHVAKPTAL